ncbi:MAG: hypothetical protein HZB35_08505 [Nitrospirae bacterium]|nr:hypothetical protein [Nitrospirota bacterium]
MYHLGRIGSCIVCILAVVVTLYSSLRTVHGEVQDTQEERTRSSLPPSSIALTLPQLIREYPEFFMHQFVTIHGTADSIRVLDSPTFHCETGWFNSYSFGMTIDNGLFDVLVMSACGTPERFPSLSSGDHVVVSGTLVPGKDDKLMIVALEYVLLD